MTGVWYTTTITTTSLDQQPNPNSLLLAYCIFVIFFFFRYPFEKPWSQSWLYRFNHSLHTISHEPSHSHLPSPCPILGYKSIHEASESDITLRKWVNASYLRIHIFFVFEGSRRGSSAGHIFGGLCSLELSTS